MLLIVNGFDALILELSFDLIDSIADDRLGASSPLGQRH
jgi:hypothetical protein